MRKALREDFSRIIPFLNLNLGDVILLVRCWQDALA